MSRAEDRRHPTAIMQWRADLLAQVDPSRTDQGELRRLLGPRILALLPAPQRCPPIVWDDVQ